MPLENILCISVDGLRASALGTYGNTWHATPSLDSLASESIVFDWMFAERPTVEDFFQAVWRDSDWAIARRLADAGVSTALTTDDQAVGERGERGGFAEVRQLEFSSSESASSIADTELAQLFAVAIDQLAGWAAVGGEAPTMRRLLWLHARGFYGAWDAPIALRETLLDEEDPPAAIFITPPTIESITGDDELLLHRVAYAAQAVVLDECIGALMAAIAELGLEQNTLVVLLGVRGYALGEHGGIGEDTAGLYSERLHIPCLIRFPETKAPPPRRSGLAVPQDLYSMLLGAIGGLSWPRENSDRDLPSLEPEGRQRPYIVSTDDRGDAVIRTPAWLLLRRGPSGQHDVAADSAELAELYFKPDDRWEANEIASRMPDVADRLLAILQVAVDSGKSPLAGAALDDDLTAHGR